LNIERIAVMSTLGILLVLSYVPLAEGFSATPQHYDPACCNYSLTVSPGSYSSAGSGAWIIPPSTAITLAACTNDGSVGFIGIAGQQEGGPGHFSFSNEPVKGCVSITTPPDTFSPGQKWAVHAEFCTNFLCSVIVFNIKDVVYTQLIVSPQFPLGAILAVLSPLAALILYGRSRKPSL
jgi:hypothetical protein